ncbi:MAG: PD-(D/E)XK nuclease-like domain-containing protein [Planctomycetaceae bacterium]
MALLAPWKQKPNTSPVDSGVLDFLICEPADEYHAKAADFLSSHQLANFRKSPLLYHRKKCGLIPDEVRPAYLIGRGGHTLILEGRKRFDEEFAVGGPANPKTGNLYGSNTKAFAEWAEAQGKPVLTREQFDLLLRMHLGVARNELAGELLSQGVAEGVVRDEYCDTACQIRIDWLNPERGIVDLKTCDDLTWFEADARRYGYVHQMAFYRAVLAQVIGVRLPVHIIAVEKREPFRCGVWQTSKEVLGIAQRENEAAIERLQRCEATNTWNTGYEDLRIFDSL